MPTEAGASSSAAFSAIQRLTSTNRLVVYRAIRTLPVTRPHGTTRTPPHLGAAISSLYVPVAPVIGRHTGRRRCHPDARPTAHHTTPEFTRRIAMEFHDRRPAETGSANIPPKRV
ncbi:hypothetical protein GCM10018963_56620 [Saccharothrix longispora]